MPNLETSGANVYFETRGLGPAIILIPGFASGAWSWKYQVEALAKRFKVITFDPRGIASSSLLDGGAISIETIADDVAALLDRLELEKARVLGVSFGGFVAQQFALKHANRLDKLVLASTSAGGTNHVLPSPEVLAAFAPVKELNSIDRIRQHLTAAFSHNFVTKHKQMVEDFCNLREANIVPEDIYLAQLAAATAFDLSSRAGEIEAPTLVITGTNDQVVPPENSRILARIIPNAKLIEVAGGTHMMFVEDHDRFNSLITDFLQ